MNAAVLPRVTLRSQVLRIVVAALLPLVLIAVWQAVLALEDSRNAVTARLKANARLVAEQERDPFIILRHTLAFAATLPEVRNMDSKCNAMLAGALEGAEKITNFLRTDAAGRARCSGVEFTPGEDLSRDAWWQERDGRRTLYLATPQIGRISQRLISTAVLPLFSADGSFQGTVSAGVSISDVARSIRDVEARLPGALVVTNSSGAVLVASEKVGFARLGQVLDAQQTPQSAISANGTEWTYVSAPIYEDQIMVVYAERANAVMRAAWTRLLPSLLLPLLALILTSVAIWFVVRRSIVRWLDLLRQITGRISGGDFRVNLAPFDTAPKELAEFAADLDMMAQAIDQQESSLRRAYEDKVELTREVNHRVKNNLQIIASLLALQSAHVQDTTALGALNHARMRIGALGLIHRLLYEGDNEDDHGMVALDKLVPELCGQLSTNYRYHPSIELVCETENFILSGEPAIPLTLLIVEAVSNAYHHAFKDEKGGKIRVRVLREGQTARLEVSDNGVGFVVGATMGGTIGSGTIGLNLMQAYTEQIGGQIDIASSTRGSVISITFPINS